MESIKIDAGPSMFVLVWSSIALLHMVCACFHALVGGMYVYLPTDAVGMVGYVELLQIAISRRYFRLVGWIYVAISATHTYTLAKMIYQSLRLRTLVFSAPTHPCASPTTESFLPPPSIARLGILSIANALFSRLQVVLLPKSNLRGYRTAVWIKTSALSIWKSFNVASPNYDVVYIIRELFQTSIQTYQAYRVSALVARPWMNNVLVCLVVANCWATPLIQRVLRLRRGPARLLCIAANLLLDFISYMAFPVALFVPYYKGYNPKIDDFDLHYWYTDVWLIHVFHEWQMLFMTSFLDGLSKLFIAYNIAKCLRTIPKLIHRHPPLHSHGTKAAAARHSHTSSAAIVPAPRDTRLQPVDGQPGPPPPPPNQDVTVWRDQVPYWGHRILALWGLLVLALHVHASSTSKNTRCMVQVRPWMAMQPACSLMEINCYDGRVSGNASSFDAAIASIDHEWLSYLIIRHCGAVEITPRLQELPWLIGFKMYNSTIVHWGLDAALTKTHHPQIKFVFIVSCNMTEFPPGLYHPDFPPTIGDLELTRWNVTSLPPEIVDAWPNDIFLLIEEFQFPAFPEVLTQLRPRYLSVVGNNFSEIPEAIWENPYLFYLKLNNNPIRALPSHLTAPSTIVWLDMVQTEVAFVPQWLIDQGLENVMAGSTPFCEGLQLGNASALGMEASDVQKWQGIVNCSRVEELLYLTGYPLAQEEINNPVQMLG